ncbi:helix-turn-helix domain-containing protein [Erwinia tracheiphila]|uniref:Transcriptional regulator n=1 Tax=Erwinia tracheiphila TaxID=65700 RepID=A0A0M2KD23_9GAMM|nr:helix-turn-helix transcriptional regulator [Erwinia tracheiphila]AXF78129.1 transcriptional regulator [Erwinia tracheiphila]EOS94573.1 sugar fermentation stimulation protein b (ner-like protein) [Erwinia tracheiphila PSU-1]KKF36854.1 transcriptional regulator [Erwinia tracheiphila]UIA83157.1 helix-turn-helix domain-containing protein [Erwinia tracheiphila]UIA88189.1 helix-turn-helix domain-containing protein [Erwinia tracheiphila]
MKAEKDWHPSEVSAALKKKGSSVSQLSREAGLASSTLANALYRRWPKGEVIIALALGISPSEIWPSRYPSRKRKNEYNNSNNN